MKAIEQINPLTQSRIHHDYSVSSPNTQKELWVPKRYAQVPIARLEKPEDAVTEFSYSKKQASYSPIKQSNVYQMRDNSPLRGQAPEEFPRNLRGAIEAPNEMRTQPMKVELGLEHGNTYQQAVRARPSEYSNSVNNSSVAYPFKPAQELSSNTQTFQHPAAYDNDRSERREPDPRDSWVQNAQNQESSQVKYPYGGE